MSEQVGSSWNVFLVLNLMSRLTSVFLAIAITRITVRCRNLLS